MSTRFGEWASNVESDRHFSCEGITQQPSPFYNGNFSSSIWGNPPTPPLWRDTPPPSFGAASKVHGQASGRSSLEKHKVEPVTPCKTQPSAEQEERASNWTNNFSSRLHTGSQDSASSPFTFGFPAPPPASSFSYVCNESMQSGPSFSQCNFAAKTTGMSGQSRTFNGSSTMSDRSDQGSAKGRAYSLEELSNSWAAMLQAQAGSLGSLDGLFAQSLVADRGLASDAQQFMQHGHGNPIADAEVHRTPLHDQHSAHQFAGSSSAGPDLLKSETAPSLFDKKDDLGTFVFGSSPVLGVKANARFSSQKGFYSPASRSKPTLASTKGRKHNNVTKQRSSAVPMNRAFQPGPSQCNMNGSCSSNSFFKFTMGVSDTDSLQCPEPGSKDRSNGGDSDLRQAPSFFPAAATSVSKDGDSPATANVKESQNCESQHAQAFGKQFSAWNPFPSRAEGSLKDSIFAGAASSKGTSHSNTADKKPERRETRSKAAFWEELSTNKASEESKLTESNLNSPGKLSVEDLRERAVKGGKLGEEIKRQKENQEPNFSFGSQRGSKPFVFGSFKTTGNTKHTVPSIDDMMRTERSFKGTKDSKVLEHLVAKLGERMANLGKSHDTTSDQDTVFGGNKEWSASEGSFCRSRKVQEEKGKATCRSEGGADASEIKDTLGCYIDEIREQLSKLGRPDDDEKAVNDRTGATSSFFHRTMDDIALEHAVTELREQISKLGHFDDEGKDETAKFSASGAQYREASNVSSSILHAIEELSKQIAKLGMVVRDKNEDERSSSRQHQNVDAFTQSVEELRERVETLGKVDEKGSNGNTESKVKDDQKVPQEAFVFSAGRATARKDGISTQFPHPKGYVNNGRSGGAQFNPFVNVSCAKMFSSNQAESSSSCPTANPFTAGQPLMANPFTARPPSMVNPFTAGQPSSIPEVYKGTKLFRFEGSSVSYSANAGSSIGGFEFKGVQGPFKGPTMQRRCGRTSPILKSREKTKLARLRRSAHFTSTSHSPGSPMDFSPCANKAASSSSSASEQESPAPKLDETESMNVEEIRIATSNMTFGNDMGSCDSNQKGSGPSKRASGETNPFVLQQKKGTWRRAPKKGAPVHVSTEGSSLKPQVYGAQTAYASSSGIDRSSPLPDPKGVDSSEGPQRHAVWNSSSGLFFSTKVEKCMPKAATKRTDFSWKLDEMNKDTREMPASSSAMKSPAAEQTCEKWRLRGNQAYAKGDYEKAEDCYTRGASSVLPGDTSESCIRASMLCYSNRAATRMAVGRMREALADCKQGIMLVSSFLRARLRAASCHLALGESKAAAALFMECWRLAKAESSSDKKVLEEAKDGIRKSQNFDNLVEKASTLFQKENGTDASVALQLIEEALTISPFSEATQELKAQVLFVLRRFEDIVQLCDKTLPSAEENHGATHGDESLRKQSAHLQLWRWRMSGKALFQLGRLDESLSLLMKYEEAICGLSPNEAANTESLTSTVCLIRDLLQHKAAGNESFQAGRHAEALEHYTAALSCNSESRPYNAVCFCNRAAASQALGHIADAIADCSRAIVLDSCYAKAISRRATLHEIIRDFGQTCNDLQRLITLLEGQEAISKSPKMTRAGSKTAQDLKQARERLDKATKEIKKESVVDHYLILGLDVFSTPSDIKKAYRKAALKHHPDKAGQFLVRGENGDDGSLWKEVGDEVCRDAERLFKLIGESYAILSDPVKRSQYDLEQQILKARNSTYPEDYSSPLGKSGRWHQDCKDGSSGQSPRYHRWQNGPDAAQPDTYSERDTWDSSKPKNRRHRGRRSDYYYWEAV